MWIRIMKLSICNRISIKVGTPFMASGDSSPCSVSTCLPGVPTVGCYNYLVKQHHGGGLINFAPTPEFEKDSGIMKKLPITIPKRHHPIYSPGSCVGAR